MSAAGFVAILTAVPVTFGVTRRWHERIRARWRLRHHDSLDDDSREGDLVFVGGTVRALDETLVAPLSGRTCVAYRSSVKSASSKNPAGNRGETMQVRPFAIERDDGSSIAVVGDRAIFGLAAQKLVDPERQASFLARHAFKGTGSFSEVLVEVGARVYVGGTLVLVPREEPPTGELGFRDLPPPDPQLVGNRETPLVIVSRGR